MDYNKKYSTLSFISYHSYLSNYGREINIMPYEYEAQYLELYEKFKDNKLKNNTSVYLTRMAELPSYKLKNYIEENKFNITLTRVYSKLNAIIISDNFIRESYIKSGKLYNYHIIPVDYIKSHFKKYIINSTFQSDGFDAFLVREDNIKEWSKTDLKFLELLKFPYEYGKELRKGHGFKKTQDNYEAFYKLKETVENYNLEIIFDHNINNEINKDMVIDTDIFQNIFNMLKSKDKGNIEIAKEIIANSNIEESKPYLVYLFNLFPLLRRSVSNNKNYDIVRNELNKEIAYISANRNSIPSVNMFVPNLINKHPHFIPQYMDCFKIHMNSLIKKDIIKEIILT